jgi:hypothetical protein
MSRDDATAAPRKVFLFSGHMIDAPGRSTPRFPPAKEPAAAEAIAAKLDELGAEAGDVAICGGACGGDLLFAEAALARGLRLQVLIPFDEPTFLAQSVDFANAGWRQRYIAATKHPCAMLKVMPHVLGPLPEGADPYERENKWLLDTALAWRAAKLHFVCLWDGGGGDGPGGTRHMVEQVRRKKGSVHWLDMRTL